MASTKSQRLALLAVDSDDLAVISAALQDAVGKVGDIAFEAEGRRLTVALNRYRWEAAGGERVRCALQIGSVSAVRTRRIRREAKDAVLALLAIGFEPGEAPGGTVTLSFAGGGDLQADVECLDAVLADLSDPWPAKRAPAHEA